MYLGWNLVSHSIHNFPLLCKLLSVFAIVEIEQAFYDTCDFSFYQILFHHKNIGLVLLSKLPLVNGVFMQSKLNHFLYFPCLLSVYFVLSLQHGTMRLDDEKMGLVSFMVKIPDLPVTPNDVSVIVLYCTVFIKADVYMITKILNYCC